VALALALPLAEEELLVVGDGGGGGIALPLTPFKLGKTPFPPAPAAVVLTAGIGPGFEESKYPVDVKLRYGSELTETF